jgi:hypothetical protein
MEEELIQELKQKVPKLQIACLELLEELRSNIRNITQVQCEQALPLAQPQCSYLGDLNS